MAYIGKSPTPVPLSASDLNDDIISLAKMASGTDGNIITYDTSGNPVAVATGNDGQVLTSAGAGQPCAFEAAGGAWNLISTFTSDGSDATAEFTSGIDSTYKKYVFEFINIHPETDNVDFTFNVSIDGGSNYNVAKQSTFNRMFHDEADTSTSLMYHTGFDLSNGTGEQPISTEMGADNDQVFSGIMYLYNPADTTYQKNYLLKATGSTYHDHNGTCEAGGYINTTSAVDAVRFMYDSGEIQGGIIKMYGIT